MLPTDKEVAKLIKKIQKKVADDARVREHSRKPLQTESITEDPSSEIFNEMKKLPFTA